MRDGFVVLCWQNGWMPVGSPHFPMGYNESKGWLGSTSTKSLLHHSNGAVYGVKGMKQTWRDRPAGKASPHQDWDGTCCWGPQPEQEECFVLCLTLFSPYTLSLMVVLCMP